MDLILNRVYISELDVVKQAKIWIQLSDVSFFEEYQEDAFIELQKPIITIHLYSGDAICVMMSFSQFATLMEKFRKEQIANGIKFNSN